METPTNPENPELHNEENNEIKLPTDDPLTNPEEITVDAEKVNAYVEQLKTEQNLPMGIGAGFIAALISGILWAVITVATEYQIAYMAIGVGFLVGMAVRLVGKGLSMTFGIAGAALALFGCLLGNYFSIVGFIAKAEGLGYLETLGALPLNLIPELLAETFSMIDLLFYGIALYMGYNYSFREITEEELMEHAM